MYIYIFFFCQIIFIYVICINICTESTFDISRKLFTTFKIRTQKLIKLDLG